MALLQPKTKTATRVLSARVPTAVADELDEVRRLADAAGLHLDVNAVVAEAIGRAVRQARAELIRPASQSAEQKPAAAA